jgi:hypothetical protein
MNRLKGYVSQSKRRASNNLGSVTNDNIPAESNSRDESATPFVQPEIKYSAIHRRIDSPTITEEDPRLGKEEDFEISAVTNLPIIAPISQFASSKPIKSSLTLRQKAAEAAHISRNLSIAAPISQASSSKPTKSPLPLRRKTAKAARTPRNPSVTAPISQAALSKSTTPPLTLRQKTAEAANTLGVREIFVPRGRTIIADVVFVHGLTGKSHDTWLHQPTNTHWPSNLLPADIQNVRVLGFGYDADVASFWGGVGLNKLHEHAENMIGQLSGLREETNSVYLNYLLTTIIQLTRSRNTEK